MTNSEKAREYAAEKFKANPESKKWNITTTYMSACEWKDQQHAKECESLVGLAVKEARKVFVEKTCEFLDTRLFPSVKVQNGGEIDVINRHDLIKEFKKIMEEQK